MRTWILCSLVSGGVLLTGCGSSPQEPARHETVLDPMLQQMDKAKQQAAEMEKRKDQLDAELQTQEH